MARLKFLILFVFSSTLFYTSCKDGAVLTNTNDTLTSIPADASMVTKVDVKSLMDKMDFAAVQKMEFYQDAIGEMRQESKIGAKIMENPTASGLDLSKNMYFAYDIDPKVIGNVFSYASVSVKDMAAFEAMLKEANLGEFETKEGYKIVKIGKKQIVAWSDEMAIIGNSMSYMDIEKSIAEIFSTDKENSIATNANFKASLKGGHDVSSWFSSNAIADNSDAKMAVGFMNIKPDALKDNFTSGYVDFVDGEIVSKSKFEINNELSKDLNLFFKDNPKTNFSKYIPTENMGFGMTAALDLKGINQVLSERPQMKSFANFALKEYGLELDQIVDALGGDIILTGYSDGTKNSKGAGLFATNIADKAEFNNLLKVAEEVGFLQKDGDRYKAKVPKTAFSTGASLMIHDGLLFVSEDDVLLDQVKSGNFKASDLSKKIKTVSGDNIFSLVTDFNVFKEGMDEFQKFGGRFMELKTNRKNADFNMEFEDKKTNSLKQIMQLLNDAYLESKKKEGKTI